MKIKVNAAPLKSCGFRGKSAGSSGNTVVRALTVTIIVAMMFATKLAAAQQVVLKAARPPRVYNALITSDQELLPSQADPIVTPVFRASPFQFFYGAGGGWPGGATYTVGPSAILSESAESIVDASSEIRNVQDTAPVDEERRPVPPVIKNNGPADARVPDVPPPPLPVSNAATARKKDKKRPEEYPPAPVGFAI